MIAISDCRFPWARRPIPVAVAIALHPGTARAECLSGGCLDGLVALVVGGAVYGALAIVLLVLLARRKRRAAFWLLGCVLAIGVGVPLASQAWLAVRAHQLAGSEVAGTPPPLHERVPLLLEMSQDCYNYDCAAIVDRAGPQGIYAVPLDWLAGMDLAVPLDLASLPIQLWRPPEAPGGMIRVTDLTPDQIRAAAAGIDYVVITNHRYFSHTGAVEAALRQRADLSGMSEAVALDLAMAPIPKGGPLALTEVAFDILDLRLLERGLGVPLAPYHTVRAPSDPAGLDAVVRAICGKADGALDPGCTRDFPDFAP